MTMKQFHILQFSTDIGTVQITCTGKEILSFSLLESADTSARHDQTDGGCELCRMAKKQVLEYLNGRRKQFDLPLSFSGNALQLSVWKALAEIPYGETVSYSELADAVHCRSIRAVGTAVGQNPLPIIIPCHRVIRKDGSIGNYSFGGPEIKRKLLTLESSHQ